MRQIYSQAGAVIMLAVCAAALRWGGRRERRVAVLLAAAWLATLLAQRLTGQVAPVGLLFALDAAVFAALLALSWRDRQGWLTYAVGLQAVALAVHALRLFSPAMYSWTYLSALAAISYGLLTLLGWSTWTHARPPAEGQGVSS